MTFEASFNKDYQYNMFLAHRILQLTLKLQVLFFCQNNLIGYTIRKNPGFVVSEYV